MRHLYGIHAVDGLLRHQAGAVQRLLVQQDRQDKRVTALLELAQNQGVRVSRVSREELDALAAGRHQGVVAEVPDAESDDDDTRDNLWREADLLRAVENSEKPVLILILDGITDPHNLGACLRSADAAGATAVVVPKDKSADLTPAVHKVACGAAQVMPFVRVTNLVRTMAALQERGVWLFGAAGDADTSLYDCELSGSIGLVLGAEGGGMRRLTRQQCDFLVQLPMAGTVSSLNVSVATGICLFEAVRQRALTRLR